MSPDELEYLASRIDEGAHYIPAYMVGAVKRYVLEGIPPGSFLQAVLENDLIAAFGAADVENTDAMRGWTILVYNCLPSDCHGSRDIVRAYMAARREDAA
jgi:hypothetical protein